MKEEKAPLPKYCHLRQNFCFRNQYLSNDTFFKPPSSVCSSWTCAECQ